MADEQATDAQGEGVKVKGPKPIKTLPTTRISFPKQLEMLRAYGAAYASTSAAVTPAAVADLLNMKADTVRLTNQFFTDSGLLTRADAGFIPNADVLAFHRAYEWKPEGAEKKLRPSFKDQWFAKALTTRLAFRGVLSTPDALALLADESAATPAFESALELLLEYLHSAGVIEREGTNIRTAKNEDVFPPRDPKDPAKAGERITITDPLPTPPLSPPGAMMRTVTLPLSKGTITLSGELNYWTLTGDERKLVNDLTDKFDEFERKSKEPV